jgi:hypothetical protein
MTKPAGKRQRQSRPGRAAGRPTKFKPEYVDIAAGMTKNGASDADIAQALGVTIRTVWRWQAEHEAFYQALVVPSGAPDDRVERSLYQRAIGYTFDSEKVFQYEGAPVRVATTEHCPPDSNAAMRWLTNRRPDRWRDKVSAELSGADGKPLIPESSPRDVARAVLDILRGAQIEGTAQSTDERDEIDEPDEELEVVAPCGPSATGAAAHGYTDPKIVAALKHARKIGSEDEPSPASPRATPAPTATQLQPGEREVRDNGAVISFDLDVGRYAITDAFGRARGYRPTFETAIEMADALPQQPTERKARDNREPRDAPEITHDAAVERTARRAEPRVLRRPPR